MRHGRRSPFTVDVAQAPEAAQLVDERLLMAVHSWSVRA
jgi:hypothetical protein